MQYTTEDNTLFCLDAPTLPNSTAGHRIKRVKSGDTLEYEIYPVYNKRPEGVRAKKAKPTSQKQQNQNEKNARKRFRRLLEANFGKNDYYATFTAAASLGEAELRRLTKNYIARWRGARKKAGLSKGKYVFVIEVPTPKSKRAHVHMVLEGGAARSEAERLWTHGRTDCRRLQPDECGLIGLAEYLMKDPKGRKRWGYSKGLKQPIVTYSEISKSKAQKIAEDYEAARSFAERRAKGYRATSITTKYSEYIPGAYIYITMRRII